MMNEVMVLFDAVVNSRMFIGKPFILFLNKIDVFEKKLATHPLSEYFPDYQGSNVDLWAAAGYFDRRLRECDRTGSRQIYTHFTNATDTTLMRTTLKSVHDVIF